jgi:hypothetical protein
MEKIAPTVIIPGVGEITPSGKLWIVAFAMAGCKWADEIMQTEDFRVQLKEEFKINEIMASIKKSCS